MLADPASRGAIDLRADPLIVCPVQFDGSGCCVGLVVSGSAASLAIYDPLSWCCGDYAVDADQSGCAAEGGTHRGGVVAGRVSCPGRGGAERGQHLRIRRRQPALPTLAALVDATGFDLDVRLRRRRLDRLTGPIGTRLRGHLAEVLRAAGSAGITVHGVFGSVARGEDRPDSDVDLLVDLPSGIGLFGVARVKSDCSRSWMPRLS